MKGRELRKGEEENWGDTELKEGEQEQWRGGGDLQGKTAGGRSDRQEVGGIEDSRKENKRFEGYRGFKYKMEGGNIWE